MLRLGVENFWWPISQTFQIFQYEKQILHSSQPVQPHLVKQVKLMASKLSLSQQGIPETLQVFQKP